MPLSLRLGLAEEHNQADLNESRLQGGRPGDIKTVTTPVEAYVALSSDRGSTPLASTMKAQSA